MHIKKLREFFAENKPENVPRAEEFFHTHGKEIWTMLSAKYPGKTDRFFAVSQVLLDVVFDCLILASTASLCGVFVGQELGLSAHAVSSAPVPSTPPVAANVVAETKFQNGMLKIDMYGTQESLGVDGKQFVVRPPLAFVLPCCRLTHFGPDVSPGVCFTLHMDLR